MAQKTVLKVFIACLKCKKKLLKAVCTLERVDKIEVDAEKGTLTVTGDADPYDIILRARKVCKHVEVVTVGPPPAPPKDKKAPLCDPNACPQCQQLVVVPWGGWVMPSQVCSIL